MFDYKKELLLNVHFFGVEIEVLNLALFARFDVTSIISTNIAARLLAKEYGICERVRLG